MSCGGLEGEVGYQFKPNWGDKEKYKPRTTAVCLHQYTYPADLLTQGLIVSDLSHAAVWCNRPSFLIERETVWPWTEIEKGLESEIEVKKTCLLMESSGCAKSKKDSCDKQSEDCMLTSQTSDMGLSRES